MKKEWVNGCEFSGQTSAVDQFKKQFSHLESGATAPLNRQHTSLPRPCLYYSNEAPKSQEQVASFTVKDHAFDGREEAVRYPKGSERLPDRSTPMGTYKSFSQAGQRPFTGMPAKPGKVVGPGLPMDNGASKDNMDPRRLARNGFPQASSYNGVPAYSYPRRIPPGIPDKDGKREPMIVESVAQGKNQFVDVGPTGGKLTATQTGLSHYY